MTAVRVALLALVLTGCAANTIVGGVALDHTEWRAVRILGRLPVVGHEPTLTFTGSAVLGSAGCNGFGSQHVTIDGENVRIQDLGMTAMLCGRSDSELMRREGDFFVALDTAAEISFRDGQLVIMGGTGELVFARIGPSATVR